MSNPTHSPNDPDWNLIFALPNLHPPKQSLETSTLLLPSSNDERLTQLMSASPSVGTYLSAFSDEHGRSHEIAALLSNEPKPDLERIYAFRDSIALSTIAHEIARHIKYPRGIVGVLFSDYFRFYPTTLGRDTAYVVTQTQALRGIDDLEDFSGRINPAIPVGRLTHWSIDKPLLVALMRLWHLQFGATRRRGGHLARAVFRSLNMAFEAASLPHNDLAFDRDLGVRLSQWVAALEILVWPLNRTAGFTEVENQLLAFPWQHSDCRARRRRIKRRGKHRVSLPIYLYDLIYSARNTYLHGDPIRRHHMFPVPSGESLLAFAPLLYRAVLDTMLPVITRPTMVERELLDIKDLRMWPHLQQSCRYDVERALVAATIERT